MKSQTKLLSPLLHRVFQPFHPSFKLFLSIFLYWKKEKKTIGDIENDAFAFFWFIHEMRPLRMLACLLLKRLFQTKQYRIGSEQSDRLKIVIASVWNMLEIKKTLKKSSFFGYYGAYWIILVILNLTCISFYFKLFSILFAIAQKYYRSDFWQILLGFLPLNPVIMVTLNSFRI